MYVLLNPFHIIVVVCWFACLFYLSSLFVYHGMSEDQTSRGCFCVMDRKLYRGIMMPWWLASLVLCMGMLDRSPVWLYQGWLQADRARVALV
ncbi:CopD family protein, partial [Pseudomonas aeruginosa]